MWEQSPIKPSRRKVFFSIKLGHNTPSIHEFGSIFKDPKMKTLVANLVQTVSIGTFYVNPLCRWVLMIAKRLPPTYESIINDVASFGNVNLYKPNKTTWDDSEL